MPADDVKRDVSEGRMMREVPTPKDSDFRRFICSECMWNLEVRRWSKEEDAKARIGKKVMRRAELLKGHRHDFRFQACS